MPKAIAAVTVIDGFTDIHIRLERSTKYRAVIGSGRASEAKERQTQYEKLVTVTYFL